MKISEISQNIKKSKKYLLIISIFFIIFTFYFFTYQKGTNTNLTLEIGILTLLYITSAITIIYSQTKKEIHKIAFIIIILFGLFCVFLNPIMLVPDEAEHYLRSDLATYGDFEPQFYNGYGYIIHDSFYQLFNNFNNTFMDNSLTSEKISNNLSHYHSCFAHNPIFGYLIPALGILLAKLLDLSIIWTLWLGRLFNLIFYAIICAYAIKKSPKYKIPLLIVACLPLALSEGASISIDCMINALCILSISAFIKMYTTEESIENKDLILFFIPLLLASIIKITDLAFLLLLFIIPRSKFKTKKQYYVSIISFILIIIVSILWLELYSTPKYLLSWRNIHYQYNKINTSQQMNYVLSHKTATLGLFGGLILKTYMLPLKFVQFYQFDWMSSSFIIAPLYTIYFVAMMFFYPNEMKMKKTDRVKLFIIISIIYFGTYFVQYLSWTNIGLTYFKGVNARYFVPWLALLPMTFSISPYEKSKKIDMLMISFAIIFLVGFLIMVTSLYY